jgi:hypothetical protein
MRRKEANDILKKPSRVIWSSLTNSRLPQPDAAALILASSTLHGTDADGLR